MRNKTLVTVATGLSFAGVALLLTKPTAVPIASEQKVAPEQNHALPLATKETLDRIQVGEINKLCRGDRIDQQFLELRRKGYIMWDDLSPDEWMAVDNAKAQYCIAHDLDESQIDLPREIALHPQDRPLLDRFHAFMQELRKDEKDLDKTETEINDLINAANPEHYKRITIRVQPEDPRLINGLDAFLLRWQQTDNPEPGYYELAWNNNGSYELKSGHTVELVERDGKTGELVLSVHWLKPSSHHFIPKMLESQPKFRVLAETLFPRLYHKVP